MELAVRPSIRCKSQKSKSRVFNSIIEHPIDSFGELKGSDKASNSVLGHLCYSVDENGNKPPERALIDNLRFHVCRFRYHDGKSLGTMTYYLSKHSDVCKLLVEEVKSFKTSLWISTS